MTQHTLYIQQLFQIYKSKVVSNDLQCQIKTEFLYFS